MTNPILLPSLSAPRARLDALILTGNPGALALGRIIQGRPVPPREQPLAADTLFRVLSQQVVQDIDTQARQVQDRHLTVNPVNLPSLRQALGVLMPGSPHLPWACHVLCVWIRPCSSPATIVDFLETIRVWELTPMALARIREYDLEADLDCPFWQLDLSRWAAAATGWLQGYVAFQCLPILLNCAGPIGALHWLASEGARREQFEC